MTRPAADPPGDSVSPGTAQPSPDLPAPVPPPTGKPAGRIVLWALAAVLILGGLGAGAYVVFAEKDTPKAAATGLLEAYIEDFDAAKANTFLCARIRDDIRDRADQKTMDARRERAKLGPKVSWSDPVVTKETDTSANVTSIVSWPEREGRSSQTWSFDLVKESGDWKVCRIDIGPTTHTSA